MKRLVAKEAVGNSWVVKRRIGRGAMSTVYLVRSVADSPVKRAMKVVDLSGLTSVEAAEATALFHREVGMLATLAHPSFPLLVDCFQEDDALYLVMELLRGRTLEKIVEKNGPCPEAWLLPIACELADALATLHTHELGPIVFRDLKPSNVMVTDAGEVKLVDFGIARHFKPGATHDTQPLGTPGFAAPEQYGSAQTTPRSDIYSLGATLFYGLTGEDPAMALDAPPSVRDRAPGCSPEMDAILRKCLHMDPAGRWESARALGSALEAISMQPVPFGFVPQRRRGSLLERWLETTFPLRWR